VDQNSRRFAEPARSSASSERMAVRSSSSASWTSGANSNGSFPIGPAFEGGLEDRYPCHLDHLSFLQVGRRVDETLTVPGTLAQLGESHSPCRQGGNKSQSGTSGAPPER
jgi:hypothetical protein